ncbi:MAG: CoA pyrophosphatase [Bacteroidetes bacterium]|nr:CoA pyrophosphatase [Bacteroidota bacterium]
MLSKKIIADSLKNYNRKIIQNINREFIPSAVLVPIIADGADLSFLFTKRTSDVEHHKGQISFPGGRLDDKDLSLEHAALRECEEEIGLSKSKVEIVGMLDDLSVPSGYLITPIVAFINNQNWIVNKMEVESVFQVSISKFFDQANLKVEKRERGGKLIDIYYYYVYGEPIWGATAHIVKNFCSVIADYKQH